MRGWVLEIKQIHVTKSMVEAVLWSPFRRRGYKTADFVLGRSRNDRNGYKSSIRANGGGEERCGGGEGRRRGDKIIEKKRISPSQS